MDAIERDGMLRMLLEQQKQINLQLSQLGISSGNKEQPRSPDGGATSTAHYHMQAQRVPTMRVKLKKVPGSDEAIIERSAFNPDLHESLESRARRVVAVDEPSAKQPDVVGTKLPREELLTMTVPMLRLQPELRGVPDADVPDKKAEIVELILSRREAALVGEE